MTNKEPTQLEKTLVIAKTMYGDAFKLQGNRVVHGIPEHFKAIVFNPYTSAEDSQAVQEFFNINVECHGNVKEWECSADIAATTDGHNYNKDLKTAIADCAYLVCKEKGNETT